MSEVGSRGNSRDFLYLKEVFKTGIILVLDMLKKFDYLFYRVSKYYHDHNRSSPEFTAVAMVTLVQTLNLLTFLSFLDLILHKKLFANQLKLLIIAVFTILFVFNIIRYNKFDYDSLKEKWEREGSDRKKRHARIVVIYLLLSFVICFVTAIYLGSKKY
jgi:hypothetical protein